MSKVTGVQKNTKIYFEDVENFIGMTIDKVNTISKCISHKPYVNKKGEDGFILVWEVKLKSTGEKITKCTSSKLRVSDLPTTERSFPSYDSKNDS